jgi:NADH:ubiquinone oxidoreductase subunit C
MYEEFVGHPLRRDYPVNKRQPRVVQRELPDDRPGMLF